ncbi:hypothetical protein TNCV_1070571 [Trichonephila clavipes]|nr:hypothetical protein TNCV_1070571 [Trichonephila clavipes]
MSLKQHVFWLTNLVILPQSSDQDDYLAGTSLFKFPHHSMERLLATQIERALAPLYYESSVALALEPVSKEMPKKLE